MTYVGPGRPEDRAESAALEALKAKSAVEPRYRVGRTLGRTVYQDGHLIGLMDTAALAEMVVAALNATQPHIVRTGPTSWAQNSAGSPVTGASLGLPAGTRVTAEVAEAITTTTGTGTEPCTAVGCPNNPATEGRQPFRAHSCPGLGGASFYPKDPLRSEA